MKNIKRQILHPAGELSIGSSLLSVGSREAKPGSSEVEHGDQAVNGTKTASPAFDGEEDTIEAFEEGVGGFAFPVGKDASQVRFDHLGALKHASEEWLTAKIYLNMNSADLPLN